MLAAAALGYTLAPARPARSAHAARAAVSMVETNTNVAQTEDTSREKVMTFSYDMSLEPTYEKPTYPGTGNGLSGDEGEYDIIVIGSGMGGLACGAISAKYGHNVLVLESHIKPGGSAHTFSRMHNGGKYSFEVGPSIFEGCARAAPCACAAPAFRGPPLLTRCHPHATGWTRRPTTRSASSSTSSARRCRWASTMAWATGRPRATGASRSATMRRAWAASARPCAITRPTRSSRSSSAPTRLSPTLPVPP